MVEKTFKSPSESKETKPANPKGYQPWILIGGTDTEAEATILWPPDMNSQFIGRDPEGGKDWGQEEKGMTEMRWLDSIKDLMDMNLGKL